MSQPQDRADSDQNLLIGIFAVQLNFISRDDLVSGIESWVSHKEKSLGQILLEQGRLSAQQLELIQKQLEAHLLAHENDATKSLRVLAAGTTIGSVLTGIVDDDLRASLALIEGASTQSGPPRFEEKTRFRKLNTLPLGQGGQGVVWLAEDTELFRHVALKEIKPAYADLLETRLAFVVEAEITGGLDHPGIVPVHGLGYYADGRPFYAMRFLPGDNLDDAIARFHAADSKARTSGERNVALRQLLRRFIDVCNTVAYAHSRGVIHRDLKPKNIMLGKFGETVVVDWGMAKTGVAGAAPPSLSGDPLLRPRSSDQIEATQVGGIKGTHGFASPEQEQCRLDLLGRHSDIFSLGATLCVLLTGESAYRGKDRHERLKKYLRGEFTPPIETKPDTPPALDAICRKAMAYEPKDRYDSALELAGDIEHWLADEAVSVHPEPWTTRAGRWGRRHQKIVGGAAASLLVALVMTALAAAAVSAEQVETEKQRVLAVNNAAAVLAEKNETEKQRVIAVKNYQMSRKQAFDIIRLIETTEPELAAVPALHERRKELLTTASEACRRFLEQEPADVELQRQAAQIFRYAGNFRRFINETKMAGPLYADAIAQLEGLPKAPENQLRLADTIRDCASLAIKLGQLNEATDQLNRSLGIAGELRKIDRARPQFRRTEALAHVNLAYVQYRQARPAELEKPRLTLSRGVELLQELVKTEPEKRHPYDPLLLAGALNQRAIIERAAGELKEAEKTHSAAIALLDEMLKQKSQRINEADVVYFLAEFRIEQAQTWAQTGQPRYVANAQKSISVAINKLSELEKGYARAPVYREAAARAFLARAEIREKANEPGDAAKDFTTARGLLGPLASAFADLPELQADLGKARAGLGRIAQGQGKTQDARDHFEAAKAQLAQASKLSPTDQRYAQALASLPAIP